MLTQQKIRKIRIHERAYVHIDLLAELPEPALLNPFASGAGVYSSNDAADGAVDYCVDVFFAEGVACFGDAENEGRASDVVVHHVGGSAR